jgi:hypothetical protein
MMLGIQDTLAHPLRGFNENLLRWLPPDPWHAMFSQNGRIHHFIEIPSRFVCEAPTLHQCFLLVDLSGTN